MISEGAPVFHLIVCTCDVWLRGSLKKWNYIIIHSSKEKMDMIKTNSDIKTGFFEPPNESNQSS